MATLDLNDQELVDLRALLHEALTAPYATPNFELRRRGAMLEGRVMLLCEGRNL